MKHNWSMFVKLAESTDCLIDEIISSVKFTLHPTSRDIVRQVDKPNTTGFFEIGATAWDTFNIDVEISLKEGILTKEGKSEIELVHELVFDPMGYVKTYLLQIPKDRALKLWLL